MGTDTTPATATQPPDEIQRLIAASGTNATAIQRTTGVSMRELVRRCRRGQSRPGADTLARMAQGLDCEVELVRVAFETVWRRAMTRQGGGAQ